jgi:crotonobetainyl-CoA:carnitine CoA-transferase CaiB-like acyl-CoA transferase
MAGVAEGLRVLDLSWGTAGPMTTMLLADNGADVIRVERPGGARFGQVEGERVWHRGKRSATLDLTAAGDRDVFTSLAGAADILVESFRPGVTDRLGIGYEQLRLVNPGLIYCSITGYGRGTRLADRPAYDALVAARCGLQWEARGWYGSFGLAVAGPWASQLLADLGAEVVKVDPPRQAGWLATNMAISVNRSKRSVCIDMKSPGGSDVAYDLIRWADVVIFNMRPQAAAKLGLDYESVSEVNPSVIYCHTRGFDDSPRSLLPGNDQTANALAGTLWEDGGCADRGRPWFGSTSNGDLGNGFLAAIAIVQALYDRRRTGKGQRVDSSIVNAGLFNNSRVMTTPEGVTFERSHLDADQTGLSALYRIYRCADEWLCLAVVTEDHWRRLAASLPVLAGDSRFASAGDRQKHDAELAAVLSSAFAGRDAATWFEVLDSAGIPCEISDLTFSQRLFDDAELLEREWVVHLQGDHPVGRIDMIGIGIDFSDTPSHVVGPPSRMWRDTRAVLDDLGYDDARIDTLFESGAARG